MSKMINTRPVCVGLIAGPHGVRGLVRVRSFTEDPAALGTYKPLKDEAGKILSLTLKSTAKDFFIASVEGSASREAAEALSGTKIYVDRSQLPATEAGEFYEADLVGLSVIDMDGAAHGQVLGVHNYGAGTFLEIGTNKKDSFMLPFTDAFVPEIGEVVRVVIPEGWLSDEKEG